GCAAGNGNCDNDPSNGCEQPILSNDKHCGECGRDCAAAGTTCSVDRCKEVVVQSGLPFGTDGGGTRTWAVGNGAFFHVNYFNYNVRRIPMDGSPLSVVWSATSASAGYNSLLANNTHVTWVQRGTPSVVLQKAHTASATTNPTVLFTPQYQPYFLQISGTAYYWMSGDYQSGDTVGHVFTRSVNAASTDPGTAIVTVNQGIHGAVTNFHAGASALYWYTTAVTPGEVRTTPLAGGTPTVVPTGTIASGYANDNVTLRTVGNVLYYNQEVGTAFANGIYKWAPADTAGTQLVVHEGVRDFVVDANSIYYVDGGNKTYKAPLAGGAGVEIASVGGLRIIHQDTDSIYVIKSTCCLTTIYRILK
ncbi:MAG TPA: hypothetical protein PKA88_28865, partial [Polyangiaceae bacterium]|nr:hypothetical protein [Polyangiaceae bacterium]